MSIFDSSQSIRREDRRVGRIILTWVSVLTAIFVGVIILLTSHFINTGDFESSSSSDAGVGVVKVAQDWYSDKEQYSALPSVNSLPSEFTVRDILYTREYQYSRSLSKTSLNEISSELASVGGSFSPVQSVFKSDKGLRLVSFKSDSVYLVYSYALGLVGIGVSTQDSLDKLNAIFGGESSDLITAGFVNREESGIWQFYFTNDVKIDEEGLSNVFE